MRFVAAAVGAVATILAAIIVGVYLLAQPVWSKIVDEYFDSTADIEISDVASVKNAARPDDPALDIVLGNPSMVNQAIVSLEPGFPYRVRPT
jgi:hypothetical protein